MKPSLYLHEVASRNGGIRSYSKLPLPPKPERLLEPEIPPLEVSFSEIAHFEECGHRYRLASNFGFQQELATELGYGRAIHHILRNIAEGARSTGKTPTNQEIKKIMHDEFYLPFARRPEFVRMSRAARGLVDRYLSDYADDLRRVWETERPFQLRLSDGTVSGRADVILDEEGGLPGRLSIVDYKTATDEREDDHYRLQMAVYAEAARGEGLDVAAGYVHELKHGNRRAIDIRKEANVLGLDRVATSVRAIRTGTFRPCAAHEHCLRCDYRLVCAHCKAPDIE
jgi:DNA helicase-2/ATP-dependent DNA helicase PcrA